jgi:flagellar biosynthesis anti-sigma factor FlgM
MISNITPPFQPRSTAEAERLRSGSQPAAATGASEDQVQLSSQARVLPGALGAGPPVDAALVDRIGAAIAGGNYPIDPDRIAAAMFRDFIEFSG